MNNSSQSKPLQPVANEESVALLLSRGMTSLTALEMSHQKRRLAKVLSRPPDLVVGHCGERIFAPTENVGMSGVSGISHNCYK